MTSLTLDEAMRDGDLWAEYIAQNGPGVAIEGLNGIKEELRLQRVHRRPEDGASQDEYQRWLKGQAGFESAVNRRLREAQEVLRTSGNPKREAKRRISDLMETIKKLAIGIDDTDHDYLLEQVSITLGDERMTLADAIDQGRLA